MNRIIILPLLYELKTFELSLKISDLRQHQVNPYRSLGQMMIKFEIHDQ